MKYNGKVLSMCALLVATSACYGVDPATQIVTIHNKSGETVYGNIYLTNRSGTKINQKSSSPQLLDNEKCIAITIQKPSDTTKKVTEFHRIIMSTDTNQADNIRSGTADKTKITGTNITQLSGTKPLFYEITKDSKGKLKITTQKKSEKCFAGNAITLNY